jgi:hypothetical protein
MDIVIAKELSLLSLELSRVSLSRQCPPVNRPPNHPHQLRNRLVALQYRRVNHRVDLPPNQVVNPLRVRRNNLSVNPPLNRVDNRLDNPPNNRLLVRVDNHPLNRVFRALNRPPDRQVSSVALLRNQRTYQQHFHPENRRHSQLPIQLRNRV